jgi:hypothetical protein
VCFKFRGSRILKVAAAWFHCSLRSGGGRFDGGYFFPSLAALGNV